MPQSAFAKQMAQKRGKELVNRKVLGPKREPPDVFVKIAKAGREGYQWILVNPCPFCGRKHRHGAGNIRENNPEKYLGFRIAQCNLINPLVAGRVWRYFGAPMLPAYKMIREDKGVSL